MRILATIFAVGALLLSAPSLAQSEPVEKRTAFENPRKGDGQSDACQKDGISAFGRYIGRWDFQDSQIAADGQSWTDGKGGQWDFYCLGEGIAVQDFWQPAAGGFGTTLRMYDAQKSQWDIVFTGEGSQKMSLLTATKQDDGSVEMLYMQPVFKPARRITFSPPTDQGFDWELSIAKADGTGWQPVFRMRVTPRASE